VEGCTLKHRFLKSLGKAQLVHMIMRISVTRLVLR